MREESEKEEYWREQLKIFWLMKNSILSPTQNKCKEKTASTLIVKLLKTKNEVLKAIVCVCGGRGITSKKNNIKINNWLYN